MPEERKLLIVDDEKEIIESLGSFFEVRGYDVTTTSSGVEARELVKTMFFPVILLDLKMPDLCGEEVLKEVVECHPDSKVIIVTGATEGSEKAELCEMGAYDYIRKPVIISELLKKVDAIFKDSGESA